MKPENNPYDTENLEFSDFGREISVVFWFVLFAAITFGILLGAAIVVLFG